MGPLTPAPAPLPPVTEGTIRSLIELQTRELETRQLEIAQRNKELDNNAAHAGRILQAQKEDRENQRFYHRSMRRDSLIGGVAAVALIFGFAAYGMSTGHAEQVKEILQIVISAAVGALGGYGAGSRKPKGKEDGGE